MKRETFRVQLAEPVAGAVLQALAQLIADIEWRYNLYMRQRMRRLYEEGGGKKQNIEVPKIFMPKIDKARIVAVFVDTDAPAIHIVWNDEYLPVPGLDEAYRRYRKQKYGRTADVETIIFRGNKAVFDTTLGEPNPYEVSIHNTGEHLFYGQVFVWTWNHLMGAVPSPWVDMRGGYYLAKGYEIRRGTREEAEDYAKEIS